ncbi:MAG: hypothetical protein ACYDHN_01070 [Solirubrobacteraceae bacterium]
MRSTISIRPLVAVIACAAVAFSSAAGASAKGSGKPVARTGAVTHVRGSSAELDGIVVPGTQTVSYYFQYGPTLAYGSQTTAGSLPPGATRVKVGQTVTGLLVGYHYRLVATSLAGTSLGKDRLYTVKKLKSKFSVVKPTEPSVFGTTTTISGTLAGAGNANRRIVLQESPYPFLTSFVAVGLPIVTGPTGTFVFHVPALASSTQFRVATLDPRPLYSSVVTQQVAVRVTLKVRTSAHKGLVRLYGTVTPAHAGTRVFFQLRKPVRPTGKSEKTVRYGTQFSTSLKHATRSFSRFSAVVEVRRGGHYRAYVEVKKGPLTAGSSPTVVLAAAAGKTKK